MSAKKGGMAHASAETRKRARELNGKTVIVTDQLNVKRGVEIRQRWIVTVESLKAGAGGKDGKKRRENAYLAPDGSLRQTLILRDAQSGFAGESGQLWTLETDGTWKRQPFLNKNVRAAEQTGKLSKRQLQELGRVLAKYDLLGLPDRIGKNLGANPHVISISFGEKQSAMILRAGASPPAADAENTDAPQQRLAALVRLIQLQLKAEKPKE